MESRLFPIGVKGTEAARAPSNLNGLGVDLGAGLGSGLGVMELLPTEEVDVVRLRSKDGVEAAGLWMVDKTVLSSGKWTET